MLIRSLGIAHLTSAARCQSLLSIRYLNLLGHQHGRSMMTRCQTLDNQLIQCRTQFHTSTRLLNETTKLEQLIDEQAIADKVLFQPVRERIEAIKRKRIEEVEQKTEEQQSQKKSFKDNIRTIGRIIRLGKPDIKLFLYALGFILFAVLYPTTAVKLVGASIDAFNNGTLDEDGNLLIWGYKYSTVFGVMVPFMCVSAVCFWARIWTLKVLGERLVARLRLRVMKTLLRHDATFYDQEKNKVGDLISRLSSDAYVVSRSITGNLPDGLKNLLFGIISAYMMFYINPLLFGVMLMISPPITFGSVWYGEKIRALSSRLQNAAAGLTKVSEETLNATKLVQAYTAEQKELTKYSDKIRKVVQVARKEALAQSNYLVSIYLLYHSGYLACITLGVYLIINGKMSTGDVIAFTMYSELFNLALYSLTTTYMELMKGAGAGTRLFELIDYKSDVNPVTGSERMPNKINGDIEFKDVWFSYPTRPKEWVFQGVSFHVPSGSSTCLVAPSGAGKSTIATLLLRSYNIQKGEILIGGTDISKLQVRDLRREIIGVVQQEPVLLSGSILENIVYGLSPEEINKLTMDDVISVSKQANCHDFICVFPEGYDTIIGSRGALLSGGQKQRIAIARALIKRPKILILDEATSALDSKLESLINETLKDLTLQGKLTIVSIAHRLSTISKSENIIVLGKNGKVIEQGKFVQLFLNPDSELSKLLDESLYMQQEEKISEDEVEEIEREDRIAQQVENHQKTEKLQAVRSIIDELPYELRKQLIEQINKDLESNHEENSITKSKILS
ncbi:ATP-binding cassette permease mdl2 [Scheffersomyces spartinae]|uniref:ATP-binding cassette permease mdl2 n=1 Tax=Scheffersomyces spartinae TaxID=45513 RepID=A0A9P7VEJ1_9ASCO|nr:ATP-binding cassette permease mdl2 [Scheffersomyces spartinae]KAG7195806.1 ATP-binding cassette permease mdl2 [Scheffersomyces spartinae]